MMDRYAWWQYVLIYFGIFLFVAFMLLPFIDMFLTSLRPLDHLRRTPYQFWSTDMDFSAYSRIWTSVPLLGRYIINSLFVPGVAFLIPTGIWLLRSYLAAIPKELEEAAYMDGASRFYTLRRVVLPLAVPGLIVVGTATFIAAYAQQFLFAITFNQKSELQPLPAGLFDFVGRQSVIWNEMMAAALVGVLPVMLIFLFLQKYLVAGLTAGAVKQ